MSQYSTLVKVPMFVLIINRSGSSAVLMHHRLFSSKQFKLVSTIFLFKLFSIGLFGVELCFVGNLWLV